MNNAEWLEKAKTEIAKIEVGTVFRVNDLFQNLEWITLSAKERQGFGRYFSSAVSDGLIPTVCRFQPDKKGHNKYEKCNRKEE